MMKFTFCDMCGTWVEMNHHVGDGWEEWLFDHQEGCEGEDSGLTYEEWDGLFSSLLSVHL